MRAEPALEQLPAAPPSPWVVRFSSLIPAAGQVLDLACGGGRHARWLASQGYSVEAVDRDGAALQGLAALPRIQPRQADLETGPWPYGADRFHGVVVTNYLYRPRLSLVLECLVPGGLLIYETFMMGNEGFGKPSNPDFLLRPHELLAVAAAGFTVVAFEQGAVAEPKPAMVQRLCAVKGEGVLALPL